MRLEPCGAKCYIRRFVSSICSGVAGYSGRSGLGIGVLHWAGLGLLGLLCIWAWAWA
jgi:hypothetical protein